MGLLVVEWRVLSVLCLRLITSAPSRQLSIMAAFATKAIGAFKPRAQALRSEGRRASPVVARLGMPRMQQAPRRSQFSAHGGAPRASRLISTAARIGTGTDTEGPFGTRVLASAPRLLDPRPRPPARSTTLQVR